MPDPAKVQDLVQGFSRNRETCAAKAAAIVLASSKPRTEKPAQGIIPAFTTPRLSFRSLFGYPVERDGLASARPLWSGGRTATLMPRSLPMKQRPATVLCLMTLFVWAILLGGCAKMPGTSDYVAEKGHQKVQQKTGKGLIYFFRPESSRFDLPAPYYVQEDGREIGILDFGTWFVHKARPGMHLYTISTESTARVVLPVKPRHTLYVKCGTHLGFVLGRPNMEVSTAEEFKAASPKLKRVRPATAKEKQAMEARDRKS